MYIVHLGEQLQGFSRVYILNENCVLHFCRQILKIVQNV